MILWHSWSIGVLTLIMMGKPSAAGGRAAGEGGTVGHRGKDSCA